MGSDLGMFNLWVPKVCIHVTSPVWSHRKTQGFSSISGVSYGCSSGRYAGIKKIRHNLNLLPVSWQIRPLPTFCESWLILETVTEISVLCTRCTAHLKELRENVPCFSFLDASETDPPLLLFKEWECVHCDDIRRVVLSLIMVPLRVHPPPPWKMTYEEPHTRASILTFFCCINTLPKHYISEWEGNQWKSWPHCAWLRKDRTFWFTTPYHDFESFCGKFKK